MSHDVRYICGHTCGPRNTARMAAIHRDPGLPFAKEFHQSFVFAKLPPGEIVKTRELANSWRGDLFFAAISYLPDAFFSRRCHCNRFLQFAISTAT